MYKDKIIRFICRTTFRVGFIYNLFQVIILYLKVIVSK